MDNDGSWIWYKIKPKIEDGIDWYGYGTQADLKGVFDIEPAKDWTKSLMRCGDE